VLIDSEVARDSSVQLHAALNPASTDGFVIDARAFDKT
jgi:hypothetical protein